MSETHRARTFHGVLDQKLADHGGRNFDRKDEDQDSHMCWDHSCSSIFATGLATIARPRITTAMPHQIQNEPRASRPVHSQPATRAVLDAPTFSKVSAAVTKTTSKTSTNHGLAERCRARSITPHYGRENIFAKPDPTLPVQKPVQQISKAN